MAKASPIIRELIKTEGEDLTPDETVTVLCPSCGGGSSSAKTLSITKKDTGRLVFICFRDNCQIKGYIQTDRIYLPRVEKVKAVKVPKVEVLLKEAHSPIPQEVEDDIQKRYAISLKENFCRWDEEARRVLFPIFDHNIDIHGYVARSFENKEPKALTYKREDYSGAAWYQKGFSTTDNLIIVEDPTSAAAITALGIDAVALLGTNLSDAVIEQIYECGYAKVFIALDYDALSKCIENSMKIENCIVVNLEKDIKDMTKEERQQLFSERLQ